MSPNILCLALAWAGGILASVSAWSAEPIRVAVASNLQPVFRRLVTAYAPQGGEVTPIFGSSGKLYAQMVQGAPFHLFLSADRTYPDRLHAGGHTLGEPRVYALGTLVLWWNRPQPPEAWRTLLTSPEVRRVAIAHPETAPYGREAVRLLEHAGLTAVVTPKLVHGESVAQTNQFLVTGAAQMGLTARASALTPEMTAAGSWVEAPRDGYAPIAQAAVVLKHAGEDPTGAAQGFFRFLFSPEARKIFQEGGYDLP